VLTDAKGARASGVEYVGARGERHTQEAQLVILAAYSFQTPRILLNSATTKHPDGLGNSSGMLGKCMMTHTSGNVFGLFREDTENYRGTTGGQLLGQDDYEKDPRRGYINSAQWLIANALKPNDLLGIANSRIDLFGGELHKFMSTAVHHLATMTFVGESLPNPGNRLTLSRERDRFGVPIAQVTHAFGPEDILCFDAGMKQGTEIFKAAGAYDAWPSGRVKMHTMGGAIMGQDPSKSVTNSFGQLHDIPNLFRRRT
jgi:choline dehydrogenase-like flavoprotein